MHFYLKEIGMKLSEEFKKKVCYNYMPSDDSTFLLNIILIIGLIDRSVIYNRFST